MVAIALPYCFLLVCLLLACGTKPPPPPKKNHLRTLCTAVQSVKVVLGGSSEDGSSGSTYQARVVGTDAMHDLAVLQVRTALMWLGKGRCAAICGRQRPTANNAARAPALAGCESRT